MHNTAAWFRDGTQSAFSENFQHRSVLRQDLGDKFHQPGITSDHGKMTHQCDADPLSLVFVDQGESNLSSSGLKDDIAASPHDVWLPTFLMRRQLRRHD